MHRGGNLCSGGASAAAKRSCLSECCLFICNISPGNKSSHRFLNVNYQNEINKYEHMCIDTYRWLVGSTAL